MRKIILLLSLVIIAYSGNGQVVLDFARITKATKLWEEASSISYMKPNHAEKIYNNAKKILDSILVIHKKYKVTFDKQEDYEFCGWERGSSCINYHVEEQELYFRLVFNFFNKDYKLHGNYATSKEILEELENLTDYSSPKPFTLLIEILPNRGINTNTEIPYFLFEKSSIIHLNIKINKIEYPEANEKINILENNKSKSLNTDTSGINNTVLNKHKIYNEIKVSDSSGKEKNGNKDNRGLNNGNPNSKNEEYTSEKGNYIACKLTDRKFKLMPKPVYNSEDEGIVVVDIWVDKNGDVIKAVAGAKGTTTTSMTLWKLAEDAAKRAKFNADPNASQEQKGTITYTFINL